MGRSSSALSWTPMWNSARIVDQSHRCKNHIDFFFLLFLFFGLRRVLRILSDDETAMIAPRDKEQRKIRYYRLGGRKNENESSSFSCSMDIN